MIAKYFSCSFSSPLKLSKTTLFPTVLFMYHVFNLEPKIYYISFSVDRI